MSGRMISNKICRGHVLRIAFGIMFVTTLLVGNASAATPVNSCITISSPGEYSLTQDIGINQIPESTVHCIDITSSDVTLDGQGHSIVGTMVLGSSQVPSNHVLIEQIGVNVFSSTGALTNVVVKNLRVQNWVNGIYYSSASNGLIENIIADRNAAYGIHLDNSKNITLTNNNAFNNNWAMTDNHTGNVVTFGVGILIGHGSSYNTLTGNIANSNKIDGIELSQSINNVLTGNTANSNEIGISLQQSGNNNLIGNAASFNLYGLELSSANNNLIYNNYFKNRLDVEFESSINNIWNIDKTAGKNIVGGPSLGGNFWANLFGTGFSETCKDADADGICDSPTRIFSNNIDSLPLSSNFISEVPATSPQ